MASYQEPQIYNSEAESDLSNKQYRGVKFGSDAEKVVLAGVDDDAIGILLNKPGVGECAEIAFPGGGGKAKLSGTVTRGDRLMLAADGWIKATTGKISNCKALDDGVAGDYISVTIESIVAL